MEKLCNEEQFESIFPPLNLCGDNAAMIAMVGLEKEFNKLNYPANPRWALDKNAVFLKVLVLNYNLGLFNLYIFRFFIITIFFINF